MRTRSDLNLGLYNLTITQSGTVVLSEDGLRNIFDESVDTYETIPGRFIVPSGGLFKENLNVSGAGPFSITADSNDSYVQGNLWLEGPETIGNRQTLFAIDVVDPTYFDSMFVSSSESWNFMGSQSCDGDISPVYSDDNVTWYKIEDVTPNNCDRGMFKVSFTRTGPHRYIGVLKEVLDFQPNNSSHENERVDVRTNGVYFYDSQRSADYEMLIEFDEETYVGSLDIETLDIKQHVNGNLSVQYSSDGIHYYSSTPVYAGGFAEPNPNEVSPLTSIISDSVSFQGRLLRYNPSDNNLYLFSSDRFYVFDLHDRVWTETSAAPIASNLSSLTLDEDENVFYATTQDGFFFKYIVASDEYVYLSPPSTGLASSGSVVVYARGTRYLYVLRGEDTSNFFRYDIDEDSWQAMASYPLSGSDAVKDGCTGIYVDYDNKIYFTVGSTKNKWVRYSIAGNSWATINPDGVFIGGIPMGGNTYTPICYDSKRNLLWTTGDNYFRVSQCYNLEEQSWNGWPHSGRTDGIFMYMLGDRRTRTLNQFSSTGSQRLFMNNWTDIVYVPTEDRMYAHGDTIKTDTLPRANVLRSTGPMNEMFSIKYFVNKPVKFLRIRPSSSSVWSCPIRIKTMRITSTNQEVYDLDAHVPLVGEPGEPVSFDINNQLHVPATSAFSYIQADGSEGSRYYQIATTSGGTYKSHCVYNDLPNFQCTASNSNYDTAMCGRRCTQANGGGGASAGYETDQVSMSFSPALMPASGTTWYLRSYLADTKREILRDLDVVTVFEGVEG